MNICAIKAASAALPLKRRRVKTVQTVTTGIVLREVKVGEADRILTILTPDLGVISASARGSLRLKNKLFSGCGLFCYSEFTMTQGRSTWFLEEAVPQKKFHGLSASIEGMSLAMYLAELVTTIPPSPGEAKVQLRLLLNCLYVIAEGKKPLPQVKAVFELRFLAQGGYMPDLVCCKNCGRYDGMDFYLDVQDGTLLCRDCAAGAGRVPNLDGGALSAVRYICLMEDKKIFNYAISPASMVHLSKVAEQYAMTHAEKPLRSLEFLHTVMT